MATERTPSPTAVTTPEVDPTFLTFRCDPPAIMVYDDALGPGWLFDPRAEVIFHGNSAHISMSVDGFESSIVDITQDVDVWSVPLPVDLRHTFYDLRTDEDRYYGVSGETTHTVVATLEDETGAKCTASCTFDVRFP